MNVSQFTIAADTGHYAAAIKQFNEASTEQMEGLVKGGCPLRAIRKVAIQAFNRGILSEKGFTDEDFAHFKENLHAACDIRKKSLKWKIAHFFHLTTEVERIEADLKNFVIQEKVGNNSTKFLGNVLKLLRKKPGEFKFLKTNPLEPVSMRKKWTKKGAVEALSVILFAVAASERGINNDLSKEVLDHENFQPLVDQAKRSSQGRRLLKVLKNKRRRIDFMDNKLKSLAEMEQANRLYTYEFQDLEILQKLNKLTDYFNKLPPEPDEDVLLYDVVEWFDKERPILDKKMRYAMVNLIFAARNVDEQLAGELSRLYAEQQGVHVVVHDDPNAWAEEILESYRITSDRNYTDTVIKLRLLPEQVKHYGVLQQKIAEIIPFEYNRPGIEVEVAPIYYKEPGNTYCIGGGVGPLTDAAILVRAVEGLSIDELGYDKYDQAWKDVRIVLFSAPSPMRGAKQLHHLPKLFPWWERVKEFMDRWKKDYKGNVHYVIASNTAHVHRKKWLDSHLEGHLQDLTEMVAQGIKESSNNRGVKNPIVLILGTTEGYKKKLYPEVLAKQGVPYIEVDEKQQQFVQEVIDQTKQDRLLREHLDKFRILIADIFDHYPRAKTLPITHILLGCTELPMALQWDQGFLQILKEEGIEIVNTEELFADQIALNMINKSQPGEEKNVMVEQTLEMADKGEVELGDGEWRPTEFDDLLR